MLIRGESGTGKELVARAIYQHSPRSQKPLVVVNCAAIPETLLESELFGYEPGAFTGATTRRIGKFEQAHGGTIFLDEIGDIPQMIQAKILRALQERTFQRLGGNETLRSDARVLCATNRDLEQAIAAGGFREDLYHRINVVTLLLPALRQHPDDIPLLVDYFLARYARAAGVERPPLAQNAMDALVSYPWPGNVRELEHLIQRLMIFAGGYTIQADDLPWNLRADLSASKADGPASEEQWLSLIRAYLRPMAVTIPAKPPGEDRTVVDCRGVAASQGNQTHAARLLGMPRPTLHARMQRYGMHGRDQGS